MRSFTSPLPGTLMVAFFLLSGCNGSLFISLGIDDDETDARFVRVAGDVVDVRLSSEVNGNVQDASVGLAAFVSGVDRSGEVAVAYAGLRDGATVGAPVTSGTARYDTVYQYTGIADVRGDYVYGVTGWQFITPERRMTLDADFGAGTLRGSSPDLQVTGQISGADVTGDVLVRYDVPGGPNGALNTELRGVIGSTGVLGAFQGEDRDTVIAGGLVGTRQ